jgi:hypothetical protein
MRLDCAAQLDTRIVWNMNTRHDAGHGYVYTLRGDLRLARRRWGRLYPAARNMSAEQYCAVALMAGNDHTDGVRGAWPANPAACPARGFGCVSREDD